MTRKSLLALSFGTMTAAILLTVGIRAYAQRGGIDARWLMAGHNVLNSRAQPDELIISPRNAARLAQKWNFTTLGDVSATPAVVADEEQPRFRRLRRRLNPDRRVSVYFPDWGGKLWKLDAETGQVLWSRSISDYNGIAASVSRTSPIVAHDMVYIGDLNGNLIAADQATGELKWKTLLDVNPAVIVTSSPIILGNRIFVNTSSNESAYARTTPGYLCCKFRGSLISLDAFTGKIIWQSYVLPDNAGQPDRFSGGAFVNPPAIDPATGLIYAAAGQTYTQPDSVTKCLAAAPDGWSETCVPKGADFNSVIAFDIRTGERRWAFRGAGLDAWQAACGSLPASVTWCPPAATATGPANRFSVWDFAGSGANVFPVRIDGRWRTVAGIGQKSGVYWALDAATGKLLWNTLVGPGSDPGGIQWGTAYDGTRIYAAIGHNTGQAYTLLSGQTVTGGSWAALDPATGKILWQTADPQNAPDLAALSVANRVLYAGSFARTGDQMYALDTATGAVLWKFAAGGSVVDGPAIVDGIVYWGSGYARTGGAGNNKFYAFSIDGR